MKSIYFLWLLTIVISCRSEQRQDPEKPNIIYILADDLGYGELGCYGQQIIETPHLDALAQSGMRFTRHYSGAPVCAPARCILLTGKHSGHAFVRGNDEWAERGDVWNYEAVFRDSTLEGQRPLPADEITVAELLKEAGYITGMTGKWGLGAPGTDGTPGRQGFDFFYGYLCQRQAHTYYPLHLWKNDRRIILQNALVAPHTQLPEGADPDDSASYQPYRLSDYAPDLMHREAIDFITDHRDTSFFLYYASPIPHAPLQAPKKWIDYYRNKIGPEEPYTGDQRYFPCQYPRAAYAAMISTLDEQVGELVAHLKKLGIYENTLIIFSSDNGPTYAGGADTPFFDSARPFQTGYGRAKGFVYEGGIRVPMIAAWPGKIRPDTQSGHLSAFADILPTLCEVAGITAPTGIDGLSFLPALLGRGNQKNHEYLYWEFPEYAGQQAVRIGDYKAIRKNIRRGNLEIELYNLTSDPQELTNIASEQPELIEKIKRIMEKEHTQATTGTFRMEALGDAGLAE